MAEDDQAVPQPDESGPEASASDAAPAPKTAKEQQAADALAAAQAAINQLKSGTGSAEASASVGQGSSGTSGAGEASAGPAKSDGASRGPSAEGASGFDLPSFALGASTELPEGLSLLKDVNLDVKIELGRTRMVVDDVLRLSEGAVVELDKLAGDPVDIFVNGRHIARGEVLVLNENFCVRISEILAGAEAAARQIASDAADAISA